MSTQQTGRRYKGGSPTKPRKPYAERNGALMTYEEVADELGVLPAMVYKLVRRGELRAVKVGNLNRVHREDLDRYIAWLRGEAS